MKCTICGGRTLPGSRLCSPCRAALRRARDETISEFIPLPRRLEALAASATSTLSRPIEFINERRARRRSRRAANVPSIDVKLHRKYPPLRAAAITLFVLAVGVLAYGFAHQLLGDPVPAQVRDKAPAVPPRVSVSPVTLAAEARSAALLPGAPVPGEVASESAEYVPSVPAVVPPPAKLRKPTATTRLAAKVEAPAATPVEVVPLVVAAAPAAAPVAKPAPDRWQSLAVALASCGGNLFARIGCEHAARAQYCEGYWGQVAQCPGGVANDHGQ